eukprot:9204253-Ditylum_brightwellii.AAC.1
MPASVLLLVLLLEPPVLSAAGVCCGDLLTLSQALREAVLADGKHFCLDPDLDAVTAEVSSS